MKGRILIAKEHATEVAGRCRAVLQDRVLDPDPELLAHERGWIWAVYYTQGKERTDFVLIHADGTPLARAVADEVIAADHACKGSLHKLNCLNPSPRPDTGDDDRSADALAAYGRYLAQECGFIQLDGLPADSDVGSRRLRLEHLFVPLSLDVSSEGITYQRMPVGTALSVHPRLSILAAPGGGKSTLLKRLAVAYADPARRGQIADDLPPRDWLPLFFRCRELRGLARASFAELLAALSQREPVRQHAEAFLASVDRALLDGRVLLLVDGLDEISNSGDRAAFVCTLRTALQAHPGTSFVVTSREAGFRHVAAHLAPVCTPATLSPFEEEDIRRLSVAWHREVVGDTEKVRADAEALAATIARNDRIHRLAANPLLLTTLLLVKRWVGSLPTKRAVLYGKAVEVLLMTWNTEGHDPIPDDEALPQLCYVASAMMMAGEQKVSRPRLAALLKDAREALPTELGYVKGTVEEFIHRVEDRSSLLMMTGHDVEDGRLTEFFEFRHLTFQEFLTARAMVEGWHPGRKDGDTLATVLAPRFEDEKWQEVIPLAAVLGGKATEALLQRLTAAVEAQVEEYKRNNKSHWSSRIASALYGCLADEASAKPETVRAAIRQLFHSQSGLVHIDAGEALATSRYGRDLREEAGRAYVDPTCTSLTTVGTWLSNAVRWGEPGGDLQGDIVGTTERLAAMLRDPETLVRCEGALGIMQICFRLTGRQDKAWLRANGDCLVHAAANLVDMVMTESIAAVQHAACWALVWLGWTQVFSPPTEPDLLGRLYKLGRSRRDSDLGRMAFWALSLQRVELREGRPRGSSIPLEELSERYSDRFSQARMDSLDKEAPTLSMANVDFCEMVGLLVLAWYRGEVFDDHKLARHALWMREFGALASIRSHPSLERLIEETQKSVDEKRRGAAGGEATPGDEVSEKPGRERRRPGRGGNKAP